MVDITVACLSGPQSFPASLQVKCTMDSGPWTIPLWLQKWEAPVSVTLHSGKQTTEYCGVRICDRNKAL